LGANIASVLQDDPSFSWEDIGRVQFDSMGLNQIIYFPDMKYIEDDSQE
jgi:hypothetical protein